MVNRGKSSADVSVESVIGRRVRGYAEGKGASKSVKRIACSSNGASAWRGRRAKTFRVDAKLWHLAREKTWRTVSLFYRFAPAACLASPPSPLFLLVSPNVVSLKATRPSTVLNITSVYRKDDVTCLETRNAAYEQRRFFFSILPRVFFYFLTSLRP